MLRVHGYTQLELLHQTDSVEIHRCKQDSTGKEVAIRLSRGPVGEQGQDVYRHEFEVLRDISSDSVVKALALEEGAFSPALVLEYFDGTPLSPQLFSAPDNLKRFLEIALKIARTVEQVHQARIIHGDIKPSNILIMPDTFDLKLIDFGVAKKLAPNQHEIASDGTLVGSLPYISPEQTGRMDRGVDHRSDLYSLGASFYEMLCGIPPFAAEQPLALIHAHLARIPTPPHELRADTPPVISRIILKLLAKEPGQRYQSATGLAFDLARCLSSLNQNGGVEEFDVGSEDAPEELVFPQKLYGREEEVASLLSALKNSQAGNGAMALVSGSPGVGKTALANELKLRLLERRVYFTEGKFEIHRKGTPYSAFIDAFSSLVHQMLAESKTRMLSVRNTLLGELGGVAGVVCELVPNLHHLIGEQPAPEKLEANEARNRFLLAMRRFVNAICTKEYPVVLFLDDLQWADSGSLMLLEDMLTTAAPRGLFIIGAYRKDEVDSQHELSGLLEILRTASAIVVEKDIPPLSDRSLKELLVDALRREPASVEALATIITQKTDNNPFFARQFLLHLYAQGLVSWKAGDGWQWLEEEILAADMPDNVASIMTTKLTKLPQNMRLLLEQASCIGSQFDVEMLVTVSAEAESELTNTLHKLAAQGFLSPTKDGFRFSNKQLQETLNTLLDDLDRARIHHLVCRAELGQVDATNWGERVFGLADHLLFALPLISEPAEIIQAAQVFLEAGRRALESAAYGPAENYLKAAIGLLPPEGSWTNHYDLAFGLHFSLAECTHQKGAHDIAAELFQSMLDQDLPVLDRAKVIAKQMTLLIIEGRQADAVEFATRLLPEYNIHLKAHPSKAGMLRQVIFTQIAMRGKTGDDFLELPLADDPKELGAFAILNAVGSAAYFTSKNLFVAQHMLHLRRVLRHGQHPVVPEMLAVHALITASIMKDPPAARRIGEAAEEMSRRFGNPVTTMRTKFLLNNTVYPWSKHYNELLAPMFDAAARLPELGDFEYASYSLANGLAMKLVSGKNLSLLENSFFDAEKDIARWGFADWAAFCNRMAREIGILTGTQTDVTKGDDPLGIGDLDFKLIPSFIISHGIGVLYLMGEIERGFKLAQSIAENSDNDLTATLQHVEFVFYHALCALALIDSGEKAKPDLWKIARKQHKKMQRWARHAPENFAHKADLLSAEMARCTGRMAEARELYSQAANGASSGDIIHIHALVTERRASLALECGQKADAAIYVSEAGRLYSDWGAESKVVQLQAQYPAANVRPSRPTEKRSISKSITVTRTKGTTTTRMLESFDLRTVLKASQAIAEELDLLGVVKQVMASAIENAGAQRGLLIRQSDGDLIVVGEQQNDGDFTEQSVPLDQFDALPRSVVRQVARSSELVVVADSVLDGRVKNDPYIQEGSGVLSMLVLPIIRHGTPVGVLYLENGLVRKAFTKDRVEILNLLSGQMATSLENARLYAELNEINKTLEQRVAERTRSLEKAHKEMVDLAHQAGKAEIATDVLHNVGNVLNSVNTATGVLSEKIRGSITVSLPKAVEMIKQHKADLGEFIVKDPKGKMLPEYFERLADQTAKERESLRETVGALIKHVDHIKAIVSMQQSYAKVVGLVQSTSLADTIDDAVRVNKAGFKRHEAQIATEIDELPPIQTDRHKVLQILVNLLSNAKYAVSASESDDKRILVRLYQTDGQRICLEVKDNGVGIAPENLDKIFTYGFTTKKAGHGFGLHSSANAAKQLGGKLSAHSDGKDHGASFVLELPAFSLPPPGDIVSEQPVC